MGITMSPQDCATAFRLLSVASSNYPVFKGPATL